MTAHGDGGITARKDGRLVVRITMPSGRRLTRMVPAMKDDRAQRRLAKELLAELRASRHGEAVRAAAPTRKGPDPVVSEGQVREAKARLEAAGKPAGYGSIAKELGVSEVTVRRRLGTLSEGGVSGRKTP